jgi:hypothetical protein
MWHMIELFITTSVRTLNPNSTDFVVDGEKIGPERGAITKENLEKIHIVRCVHSPPEYVNPCTRARGFKSKVYYVSENKIQRVNPNFLMKMLEFANNKTFYVFAVC